MKKVLCGGFMFLGGILLFTIIGAAPTTGASSGAEIYLVGGLILAVIGLLIMIFSAFSPNRGDY